MSHCYAEGWPCAHALLRRNLSSEVGPWLCNLLSRPAIRLSDGLCVMMAHWVPCPCRYDNLLMEESGQILEIETFIPMLLQVGGP